MRVIKPGELPDKTLTGTCMNCRCVVECEKSEAESYYDQRDGETTYSVKCPTVNCSGIIALRPKPKSRAKRSQGPWPLGRDL